MTRSMKRETERERESERMRNPEKEERDDRGKSGPCYIFFFYEAVKKRINRRLTHVSPRCKNVCASKKKSGPTARY